MQRGQRFGLMLSLILMGTAPPAVLRAQDAPQPAIATMETPEQLEQLVALVALYPDFAGGADSGSFHVSHSNCRSGPLAPTASKSEGRPTGPGCGLATLGPRCEGLTPLTSSRMS